MSDNKKQQSTVEETIATVVHRTHLHLAAFLTEPNRVHPLLMFQGAKGRNLTKKGSYLHHCGMVARDWCLAGGTSKQAIKDIALNAATLLLGTDSARKHLQAGIITFAVFPGLELPTSFEEEVVAPYLNKWLTGDYAIQTLPLMVSPESGQNTGNPEDAAQAIADICNSLTVARVSDIAKTQLAMHSAQLSKMEVFSNLFLTQAVERSRAYNDRGGFKLMSMEMENNGELRAETLPECLYDIIFTVIMPWDEYLSTMSQGPAASLGLISAVFIDGRAHLTVSSLGCNLGIQIKLADQGSGAVTIRAPVSAPSSSATRVHKVFSPFVPEDPGHVRDLEAEVA